MLTLLPVLPGSIAPAASAAETATGEAAALARAKATGQPVEVTEARGEYTTTYANPDGTLTLTQSTTPRRVKRADGGWGAVDATLEHRADGRVAPKGAVVDLSFSGGGPGADMLSIGKHGRSVTLGWSGALPKPVLDGATATYQDVFDGVDLQLTATAEGYREVLVVRTPEAARNPALERVELSARGAGLTVVPGAGGGVRALDEDGNTVLHGPAGQMWDSAGDVPSGPQVQLLRSDADDSGADESVDPARPGGGDSSAVLPVSVDENSIAVRPDLGLLRGPETVYPVYIDPSIGLGAQERTKISSDGDTFWMFDGDKGVGKCGTADGYSCGAGYVDRMYFEFAPTALAGKHVLDATFRARETWSFNCDPHTVDLVRTNNISAATKWPGPSQLDLMVDRSVAAGRGTLCSPDQPDAWIEFNDNPGEPDENLTSTVRSFAGGSISRLTLMLRAHDETDTRAWKRFDDNAELQVIYAYKPGVPTNVGIIPGTGTTAYCKASTDPLVVTTETPTVQARLQTQVFSGSSALLQAEFLLQARGSDNVWRQAWSGSAPDSGWDPDNTLERIAGGKLADGTSYRLKARTQSHWTYNTVPGDLWSGYSSWCYFTMDSAAPKAPRITPVSPYILCSTVCEGKGGPGIPGSFVFEPNTADISDGSTDITAYEWKLLSTQAVSVPRGSGLKTTVDDVVPPLAGTQVLSVRAKDVHNRWGVPQEFIFKVKPAEGPVGLWHLDVAPGPGQTTAADTAEVGTRHDAALGGADPGWSSRARRGDGDYSLRLNDYSSDPMHRTGYASTSGPVVNTRDSFTVSAWVQLTDPTANRVVLSAPGTDGSAFALYYSSALKKWVFNRTDKDSTGPAYIRSVADQESPAANVWTHVAGVFRTEGDDDLPDTDPSDDTIQLFVNGRPQGQPVVLSQAAPSYTPWTAAGGLQFGRFKSNGSYGEHHVGLIDEVTAWQRALSPAELVVDAQALLPDGTPANELVAHWDTASATGTAIPELSSYPVADMTVSGTTVDEAEGALILDGTAYASSAGPAVDETGSFTVSAAVWLDSAGLSAKPAGYRGQVAGQRMGGESSWALWVDKIAQDVYLWEFTRTATGSDGKVTLSATASADDLAMTDTWVTLTGVFDAQEGRDSGLDGPQGRLHLYVGGTRQSGEEEAGFPNPQQGDGALSWGRGTVGGTTGNNMVGRLESLRVWTGALTADQINAQIIDPVSSA